MGMKRAVVVIVLIAAFVAAGVFVVSQPKAGLARSVQLRLARAKSIEIRKQDQARQLVGGAPYSCTIVSTSAGSTSPGYCAFGADPTNFIGTSGTTEVDQDLQSSYTGWTQTLNANSAQDWDVVANYPQPASDGVESFPNSYAFGYSGTVDDFATLTSSFSETTPYNANFYGHAMQDDWFNAPGSGATYSDEMMVQHDFSNDYPDNNCANPGTGEFDVTATGVTFPGSSQTWYLCDGGDPRFGSGGCPNINGMGYCAVVWKPGSPGGAGGTVTQAPQNIPSGSVNLKAMAQWLETHLQPGQSTTYFPAAMTLQTISNGWEILSTTSTNQTLVATHFGVNAVVSGGATTLPTVPTSVTFAKDAAGYCELDWAAPSSSGTDPVTGYAVSDTTSTGSNGQFNVNGPDTTFKGSTGEVFNAEVAAVSAIGTGPPTSTMSTCTQ